MTFESKVQIAVSTFVIFMFGLLGLFLISKPS